MKRVRCPKCDNYIQFDETKYQEGQSLVFICDNCKKQFGIRIGKSKLNAGSRREEVVDERKEPKTGETLSSLRTFLPSNRFSPCMKETMLSDGVPKVRKPISPSKATIPVWTVATAS